MVLIVLKQYPVIIVVEHQGHYVRQEDKRLVLNQLQMKPPQLLPEDNLNSLFPYQTKTRLPPVIDLTNNQNAARCKSFHNQPHHLRAQIALVLTPVVLLIFCSRKQTLRL